MLTFTGKVIYSTDEERDIPVKDSNGVPTSQMKRHRFTKIQLMIKDADAKVDRPILCSSVDLPSSFVLPKNGSEWTTPEVRKYDVKNGIPEVSF